MIIYASIITISQQCTGLQSLDPSYCLKITITSLLSIVAYQLSTLSYLDVKYCPLITTRLRKEYISGDDDDDE